MIGLFDCLWHYWLSHSAPTVDYTDWARLSEMERPPALSPTGSACTGGPPLHRCFALDHSMVAPDWISRFRRTEAQTDSLYPAENKLSSRSFDSMPSRLRPGLCLILLPRYH